MPTKKYCIVANWKMYFSYTDALAWLNNYHDDFITLAHTTTSLVLCPSFEALSACATLLQHSPIKLGAQDCSAHDLGAFTGQVSAESLAQIGCRYCIVGHSETYTEWQTVRDDVLKKISLILKNGMTPIICVGETSQEHQNKMTQKSIAQKLEFLMTELNNRSDIFIAYEPVWAIGSGNIPTQEDLQAVINLIHEYVLKNNIKATILYGGGVTPATIASLKSLAHLDGFLLGKASTDFQELKKVVSLLHEG